MNKFVKGAKNLAFALSFVTIAACGVKKADLETLEKSFNEKIGKKADLDSCVSKNELTNINGEVEKKINDEISKMKGKMIFKEDVINANVKSSGIDVANLEVLGVDLKGEKFVVSVVGDKVVVKRGGVVVFEEFKVATGVDPVQFIADVVSLKGEFVFDESFKSENRIKFDDGGASDKIKVGDYVSDNAADTVKLVCLLGKIGVEVFEKFFDRNLEVLGMEDKKVAGQGFTGINDAFNSNEGVKGEFGVGLEVLFGEKGEFVIGSSSENRLPDSKFGFAFGKAVVKNVKGIQLGN